MIFLDPRAGSALLQPYFARHNVPAEVAPGNLDADVLIIGNGPEGEGTMPVGVERKTLRDMLACLRWGRFTDHQLDGLLSAHALAWLVLEGGYRADPASGVMQEWRGRERGWQDVQLGKRTRGRFMASELDRHLITLQTHTALRVTRTRNIEDTVLFVANLYHQLVRKKWGEHKSHLGIQVPEVKGPILLRPRTPEEERLQKRVRVLLSLKCGLGQDRATAAAKHFSKGIRAMVMADAKEWEGIEGIGKTTARNVVEEWD